jgi:hypothetical protein
MVPSSMTGRKLSSWARLKRWISSTKSSVPLQRAAAARRLEHFLQIGDAGEDRRDLFEVEIGLVGEEAGDRRLAGAGRAPEDQRAEAAGAQHAGDGALGADEMVLTDDLGQRLRAQAVGERPGRGAFEAGGGEEIGHGACDSLSAAMPIAHL